MNKLWIVAGRISFWVSWPALWYYLRNSERTRILIINEHHELLVVKGWLSGNKRWELPGGGMHDSEDPVAGALRELREETDLQFSADQLQALTTKVYRSKGFSFKLHFYRAVVQGRPTVTRRRSEIVATQWIPLADLTAANCEADVLFGVQQVGN
jgi:8-oxo-dGTP diphosphatase